jgi:transcriptional antiterminator
MDPKKALQEAEDDKDLTKDQRQVVVKHLLQTEDLDVSEMAERLNVTARTIYRDKRDVRQEINEKLLGNYGLAGRECTTDLLQVPVTYRFRPIISRLYFFR